MPDANKTTVGWASKRFPAVAARDPDHHRFTIEYVPVLRDKARPIVLRQGKKTNNRLSIKAAKQLALELLAAAATAEAALYPTPAATTEG